MINPDGSGEQAVGTQTRYVSNIFKPLKPFAGNLVVGNGNTVALVNSTNTVISSVLNTGATLLYSSLNPPLGTQEKVLDLDVSPSNDYVILASAKILQEERLDSTQYDIVQTFSSQEGKISQWNGVDGTVTAATSFPTYLISAIETWFKNMSFFGGDSFGTAFNDGSNKKVSLPNNKPPLPNAVAVNGNFMTWVCPEVDSAQRYLSLYYYGALDEENPTGLYRLLRWTSTQSSGMVSKAPLNLLVSNKYTTINSNGTGLITYGWGKHYIGVNSVNSGGTQNFLLVFLVTPTGTGTPQLGVYETQTQLFSKRIDIKQIRVYTEPTVAGNGFQIDMIEADGSVMNNGTYSYTFVAGSDETKLQGSLERINFNPTAATGFSLGLRITNTGTTNMTIKKIEVDWEEQGK